MNHGNSHRFPISTHAPRTGSDAVADALEAMSEGISTHAPRTGSDQQMNDQYDAEYEFQPTLPARGATARRDALPIADGISTHAPRTGSDGQIPSRCSSAGHFNPRSPHGERPCRCVFAVFHLCKFQPTLPARGATHPHPRRHAQHRISTHAPRTGSDGFLCRWHGQGQHISTHAPRTGSDLFYWVNCAGEADFNPRSPHGERPAWFRGLRLPRFISTHAPRTGSDVGESVTFTVTQKFQPTLPARGATVLDGLVAQVRPISTHAPRTGSDATAARKPGLHTNFNPRSPHGERPVRLSTMQASSRFQPTLPARGATRRNMAVRAYPEFQPTLPARGATRSCQPSPYTN